MPDSGTQIILCNLPIRFDTYSGCSHGCEYCFANQKGRSIGDIRKKEGPLALENFINGKRTKRTNWCDWDIPLHWGGMSDPFQPCEINLRNSLDCMSVFKSKKYPFVFSTKGGVVAREEYTNVLKDCNAVGQISMASPQYDEIEKGAPSYYDRLKVLKVVAQNTKRAIVRVQPYTERIHAFLVEEGLKDFRNNGAYGIVIEGIKSSVKAKGLVKIGSDFVYDEEFLKQKFIEIKRISHGIGLKFFCGENRLRYLGDSLTCCGCDGVEGFMPNKSNLNYHFWGGGIKYNTAMEAHGSGGCFAAFVQSWELGQYVFKSTYRELMDSSKDVKTFRAILGFN